MNKTASTALLLVAAASAGALLGSLAFGGDAPEEDPPTVRALRWARWGVQFRHVELYFPERGILFAVDLDKAGKVLAGWPGSGPRASHSGEPVWLSLLQLVSKEKGLPVEPETVEVPKEVAERIFKLADLTKELDAFKARVAVQGSALAGQAMKAGLIGSK